MRLHDNWREIVKKAWSFRLGALAAVFSIMQLVVPIYADTLPRHVFAILTAVAALGVLFARLVWQKDE